MGHGVQKALIWRTIGCSRGDLIAFLFLSHLGTLHKDTPSERRFFDTVKLRQGSFHVEFHGQGLDHAIVEAAFQIFPLQVGHRGVRREKLQILRPGVGSKIARRPGDRESCAQQQAR